MIPSGIKGKRTGKLPERKGTGPPTLVTGEVAGEEGQGAGKTLTRRLDSGSVWIVPSVYHTLVCGEPKVLVTRDLAEIASC